MAIAEVIKYDGGPDVLAWKYPSEELGTWTQLIVNELQAAILLKDGEALDIFESGTHTFETANIPLLNKIINLPLEERSPFTAEVWYINQACFVDVKWGTPTPIQIQDPQYGVFVPVRTSGVFRIQIADPRKFMIRLAGTLPAFDKNSVADYFKRLQLAMVKDSISSCLVQHKISVLELNENIRAITHYMREYIAPAIQECGFRLDSSLVREISVLKDDPAVINLIGMGVGSGASAGGVSRGIATEITTGVPVNKKECSNCHSQMDNDQRFCRDCGTKY